MCSLSNLCTPQHTHTHKLLHMLKKRYNTKDLFSFGHWPKWGHFNVLQHVCAHVFMFVCVCVCVRFTGVQPWELGGRWSARLRVSPD